MRYLTLIVCLYGAQAMACVDAVEYGFVPNDTSVDNSIPFNQFVADGSLDALCFNDRGSYTFKTPTVTIGRTLRITGLGVNGTTFRRDFIGPLIHATKTVIIEDISIHAVNGMSGSYGVYLQGLGASSSVLRNLYLTSKDGSTFQVAIYLNGEAQPLGIRGVLLEQIEAFASTSHNIWLRNVKGLTANGVQTYLAGGLVQHLTIQDVSGYRSSNILITTRYMPTLYAYNSDYIKVISVAGTVKGGAGWSNFNVL